MKTLGRRNLQREELFHFSDSHLPTTTTTEYMLRITAEVGNFFSEEEDMLKGREKKKISK